jgi:hypothetical protein
MISRGPDSGIYAMLRQAKLNNCKDKGRKGQHFSQQKEKIGIANLS